MNLISSRKDKLVFYSPYTFIREFPLEKQFENIVLSDIRNFLSNTNNEIISVDIKNKQHLFYVSFLDWDTTYFGFKTYKLKYVLFNHSDIKILTEAAGKFISDFFNGKKYCFIEIPSEDILLLQALGAWGFRTIETRLTYFRGDLSSFNNERFAVRKATENDIQNLMRVAREMRNVYDRFHADPVFEMKIADEFLATYIEQSIKGFADIILVPDENNISSDSFITAKYLKDEWQKNGVKISKMVLSAVSAKTNKGWYKKLVSEMTYHLKEAGAEYIFMNTQSANRAVIHCWESLGYSLGSTTHILSYSNI